MWDSAASMLDAHYRKLWIKKVFSLAAVVTVVAAGGFFILLDNTTGPTEENIVSVENTGASTSGDENAHTVSVDKGEGTEAEVENRETPTTQTEHGPFNSSSHAKLDKINSPEGKSFELGKTSITGASTSNHQVLSQKETPEDTESSSFGHSPGQLAGTGQPKQTVTPQRDVPIVFDLDIALEDGMGTGTEEIVPPSMVTRDYFRKPVLPMPAFSLKILRKSLQEPLYTTSSSEVAEAARTEAQKIVRRFSVNFTGGLQVSRGFKNNLPEREGLHASPFGGINIGLYFFKGFSLHSGIVGSQRGSLAASRSYVSDAGETVGIDSKTLTYLEMPFLVKFDLHPRHAVYGGMKYAHLLGAQTIITEKGSSKTSREFSSEGFSQNDVAFVGGYELELARHLSCIAALHFGLFDVTDNQVFRSGEVADRNLQVRLGVKYDLLNR